MRIAIVGTGISGLTCGWLLSRRHDITVFESGSHIGGHTNTISFDLDGRDYSVDTGFIVCNDRTYPNFLELIDHLGVRRSPSPMGFSVCCDAANLEYCGSGLSGLFAQRRNLTRPAFLRMVRDILKFNREGTRDAEVVSHEMTVGEYIQQNNYSKWFADFYLLPMGASIWSCPTGTFTNFPIRFILEFYCHHGLLSINNRPVWYTIDGGSSTYVKALTQPFADRIRLNTPVKHVERSADGVRVLTESGDESFNEVIFACHSDQALKLLADASDSENEILSAIPYQPNDAVLHTDTSVLPTRRNVWSSWNYRILPEADGMATLTYDMNQLQHIDSPYQFCVSLNDVEGIDPNKVISRHRYSHPIFTTDRHKVQQRHSEVIRQNRTSFCGAYWGNGFHEDGVRSGLEVCRRFGARNVLDRQLTAETEADATAFAGA